MAKTPTAPYFYEFGPFRIDPIKRLLLRDGQVAPLKPKCFDILLALVENSGKVIEKDDLMRRVWPDSFVEEGNLTYNVSILRKALGERAGEHQYIATIPGRGYRFVASVNGPRNEADHSKERKDVPARVDPNKRKRWFWAALILGGALLLSLAGLYWSWYKKAADAPQLSLIAVPLTTDPGYEWESR